jgi:plasmid stabilization system protein ParE
MAFDVIFLPRADADVQSHAAWLHATRSPSAANRWRTGIMTKVVLALEADPLRYPEADEAEDLGVDLRELLHGRRPHVYRVLFTIDGQTVFVHRVRHASQSPLAPGDT